MRSATAVFSVAAVSLHRFKLPLASRTTHFPLLATRLQPSTADAAASVAPHACATSASNAAWILQSLSPKLSAAMCVLAHATLPASRRVAEVVAVLVTVVVVVGEVVSVVVEVGVVVVVGEEVGVVVAVVVAVVRVHAASSPAPTACIAAFNLAAMAVHSPASTASSGLATTKNAPWHANRLVGPASFGA